MANLFAIPWRPIVQNNLVVPGAKIWFTLTGTNTASAPFSNSGLTTPRTNPVVADGTGKIPTTYLDPAKNYRVRIYSKNATVGVDTPLEEYEPYVPGVFADADALEPVAAAAADSATAAAASAGAAVLAYANLAAAIAASSIDDGVALPRITPELFGDTSSGDTGAFLHAAAAAINALGGGTIDLYPGREYTVGGGQVLSSGHQAAGYAFPPIYDYILDINGCTGPVVINMNGATIKCASGVKYGAFNDDGTSRATVAPSFTGGLAAPYNAVIRVKDCTGLVTIRNGELDGNIANATIGGDYGDSGHLQLDYDGLMVDGNTGGVVIDGVYSHHHGRDGGVGQGPGLLSTLEHVVHLNCRFENNGRQGFSMVNGNGWRFQNCTFNGTGKDIGSFGGTAPGCGIDIEASYGPLVVRNIDFENCEFVDNTGIGCNAPQVTSAYCSRLRFRACKFVGTTTFGAWVNAPYVVYEDCLFAGSITGMWSNATNPASASKFSRCTFDYNLALSPTGTLYAHGAGVATFFDWTLGDDGIEAADCDIILTSDGVNPIVGATNNRWHNCNFVNATTGYGIQPLGMFSGQNTRFRNCATHPDPVVATARFVNYAGPAFDSYRWEETRAVSGGPYALARYDATGDKETGKRIYRASATYDPPSLAAAAKTTIQTMTVTGVALGDKVEDVSFSVNLAGARIHAWVSAANTVSYYFINENGANPLDLASGTLLVKVRQT